MIALLGARASASGPAAPARPVPAATKKTTKKPAATTHAARTPAGRPAARARKTTATKPDAVPTALDRTAELSDEVLKSVEDGQRAALAAVRMFLDTLDEMLPALGDRPSRREAVINAAVEMADKLVTAQYEFLRSVVRGVDRSLGRPQA